MAETPETAGPRGGEHPGGSVILTTVEQMLNGEACRPADLGAKADGPCTDAPVLNMGASKG
ncbi:MAG TPA: hypothetical protein VJP78_04745 [Thermoleophilia bacterium]|nr:hypothetical protein [Thermoleophilia bacterium]